MSAPNNNNMNENSGMAGTGLNEPNVHGANAPVGTHPHQGRDTALAAGAAGKLTSSAIFVILFRY